MAKILHWCNVHLLSSQHYVIGNLFVFQTEPIICFPVQCSTTTREYSLKTVNHDVIRQSSSDGLSTAPFDIYSSKLSRLASFEDIDVLAVESYAEYVLYPE